jgi:hypothetical protein
MNLHAAAMMPWLDLNQPEELVSIENREVRSSVHNVFPF